MPRSAEGAQWLRVVRRFDVAAERVFDAWLDPEAIRVWMCPGEIFESPATVNARVGGTYEIVMRSPAGDDPHRGRYVEIDRPRRLAFTWTSASTEGKETLVTIEIRPLSEAACELTLVHSDLPQVQVSQHATGWRAHLRILIAFLEER